MAVRARGHGVPSAADVAARWTTLLPGSVSVLLIVVTYLLPQDYQSSDIGTNWVGTALLAVQAVTFTIVGVAILWGHPGHRIGRLFAAVGLIVSADIAIAGYQYLALQARPDLHLPLGELAAWVQGWLYVPALAIVVMLLPQLFPNGRVVSRRWLLPLLLSLVAGLGMVLTDMLRPGRIDATVVTNPTGVPAGLHRAIGIASVSLFLVCAILGFVSMAVRWRTATLRERQQLKLFLLAAALLPLFVLTNGISNALGRHHDVALWLSSVTAVLAFLGLPVAVGVGIVRHRLYDLDLVINRTVVYALLSATLLAVYVGCVVLLQSLVGPVVGSSDVAVALSTLAVAALFRPARSRIQAVVDRRFFRRRYDTQRTLAEFAGRARDEVDLDSVARDLIATVRGTVEPSSISLWVPDPATPDPRTASA